MDDDQFESKVLLGARLLSTETVDKAKHSSPEDFANYKHISCFIDLSALVKEDELNYVRLRYNEYLLQCVSGPFDLDSNLDSRQEQMNDKASEISQLKDEIEQTKATRRNSEQEVFNHQLLVDQLEREIEGLRHEITRLKDGCLGAEERQKIMDDVDEALQGLEVLESGSDLRRQKLQV
jgi:peptidoglycan hydrolase CwlO-like protein